MEIPKENIPKLLSELRAQSGLTLRDVAKQAGISHQQISFIERGDSWTTDDTLRRLFAVYNKHFSVQYNLTDNGGQDE